MCSQKNFSWHDKVINTAQVAGIETSVLANGPGKGVRIAWVNTGSGLRYQVILDRALDIGKAFYNQHSLAWLSHAGPISPRPDANKDLEWLYTFGGGLLVTCGLTHIGHPEADDKQQRGLHGRISNINSTLESIVQPDIFSGDLEMSITAVTKQSSLYGPNLELRRTISSRVGESKIRIHDVVINRANSTCPHMILYHLNFGWPLVDDGTDIIWKGHCESIDRDKDCDIFNDKHDFKKCQKPMDSHQGDGSAVGIIDVEPDTEGICTVGLANHKLNIALVIKYKKQQLGYLTNWQHWGRGEYVCALEPGTNPPIGQIKAREQNELIVLEPGERREYDLEMSLLSDNKKINEFIKTTNNES